MGIGDPLEILYMDDDNFLETLYGRDPLEIVERVAI